MTGFGFGADVSLTIRQTPAGMKWLLRSSRCGRAHRGQVPTGIRLNLTPTDFGNTMVTDSLVQKDVLLGRLAAAR